MGKVIKNYVEKWIEKYGNDTLYDLSKVNYINKRTPICVIHKEFGECLINPESFYKNGRTQKDYSENRKLRKYSILEIKNKISKLNLELLTLTKISSNSYVLVKNKYGICKTRVLSLLKERIPCIRTAINKTEYFINQAKEIHGDKYDYSLVDYKEHDKKVKIMGDFGVFEQTPHSHLSGAGCPKEANKLQSEKLISKGRLWNYSTWEKIAKESENFTGFKVYVVEFESESERFLKIGKTFVSINKRFKHKTPYKIKILYTKTFESSYSASNYENYLKNVNKQDRYLPTFKFGGRFECFKEVNIPELNLLLN